MASPDRSWIVVAVGLVATAIVAAALGAVVTLWAVDQPVPVAHAAPPAPKPAPAPIPVAPPPQAATPAPPPASPAPAETQAVPPPSPPPAAPVSAPPTPAPVEPAASPPPAIPPSPPVDTAALAPKLPYAVQFGAFNDDDHAQRMAQTLQEQGLPAAVEFHKTPKGHDLHFVRLSDGYSTMSEASSRAAVLRRQLEIDVIPVRRQGAEAGQ
jgi:cell division septation protein DedD